MQCGARAGFNQRGEDVQLVPAEAEAQAAAALKRGSEGV